jgi:Na+-driven multidrug efflux pump
MAIVTVFFFLFSAPIVRIFTQDPEVIAHGVRALQIIASGYVFYGLAMVMTQALNGAGDTKTPTWINFVCFWILQMPLAYALVKGFDASAIIAVPVSEAILALMAFYFFRRGGWKKVQV